MGINVNKVVAAAFRDRLGFLAGVVGMLWSARDGQDRPPDGLPTRCSRPSSHRSMGGLGSIPGAILGAYILGIMESPPAGPPALSPLTSLQGRLRSSPPDRPPLVPAQRTPRRHREGEDLMSLASERLGSRLAALIVVLALAILGATELPRAGPITCRADTSSVVGIKHHPRRGFQPLQRLHGDLLPGARGLHGHRRLRLLHPDPARRREGRQPSRPALLAFAAPAALLARHPGIAGLDRRCSSPSSSGSPLMRLIGRLHVGGDPGLPRHRAGSPRQLGLDHPGRQDLRRGPEHIRIWSTSGSGPPICGLRRPQDQGPRPSAATMRAARDNEIAAESLGTERRASAAPRLLR